VEGVCGHIEGVAGSRGRGMAISTDEMAEVASTE